MLITLKEALEDARKRGYGIGMFNTFNVEMLLGVMEAAEELRAPVIIGTAEGLLHCCDLKLAAAMIGEVAKRATVPVVLHLDHGYSETTIRNAVDCGFTSVMFDQSEVPYEENVNNLREMCDYAHKRGASVEGELGHVVFDTAEDTGYVYTKPSDVVDYVSRTGIDALAIAIGTIHGVYKEKPRLDIDRLKEIRKVTDVGLVLHGGSGLSDDDFRNVVKYGIQKVNIYTDVSYAMSRSAFKTVEAGDLHIENVSVRMREAAKEEALKKMRLFNCAGKA